MISTSSYSTHRFFNLMRYTWTLLVVWTLILAGLMVKDLIDIKHYTN